MRRHLLSLVALVPAALAAQEANPSVAAYGLANNYTAAARGYEATVWNPALLGLPGAPKFSLGGLIFSSNAGVGPITVNDLADYKGAYIPVAVRQGWIQKVRNAGEQKGSIDGGATLLALSAGRFGAQVSASAAGTMGLGADALEMIFLGNADAVAANRVLHPTGSLRASGFVTPSVSYAIPLAWKPTGQKDESFSLGVNAKFVMGTADIDARDNGSSISKDTLKLRFPVLLSTGSAGSGVGADVSAAWRAGRTTVGLTVANLFNSFSWDEGNYQCNDIKADIDVNKTSTNTDAVPCTGTYATAVSNAAGRGFKPSVRAGIAFAKNADWTFTGDVASQFGSEADAIIIGPKTSVGVGAEYRGVKFLPLRAGVSAVSGGTVFAGGASLRLGGYELGVAGQLRHVDGISSTNLMIGLLSFR